MRQAVEGIKEDTKARRMILTRYLGKVELGP